MLHVPTLVRETSFHSGQQSVLTWLIAWSVETECLTLKKISLSNATTTQPHHHLPISKEHPEEAEINQKSEEWGEFCEVLSLAGCGSHTHGVKAVVITCARSIQQTFWHRWKRHSWALPLLKNYLLLMVAGEGKTLSSLEVFSWVWFNTCAHVGTTNWTLVG